MAHVGRLSKTVNGGPTAGDAEWIKTVRSEMSDWRQGDVLRPATVFHMADPTRPGTTTAERLRGHGPDVAVSVPPGIVVITQTCDLVAKDPADHPFLQAAMLVELPKTTAKEARSGSRPRYAHLPQIGDVWFADLDYISTYEKAALSHLRRDRGVEGTGEQDAFGRAVGRKFSRFAFPNDLHDTLRSLLAKFRERYARDASPEGLALRRVLQIRAHADPGWDSSCINAHMTFLLPEGELLPSASEPIEPSGDLQRWFAKKTRKASELAELLGRSVDPIDIAWLWSHLVEAWARECEPVGKIAVLTADVECEDEMRVSQLRRSQVLDLDYLSVGDAVIS
jgi:hypothetical protein